MKRYFFKFRKGMSLVEMLVVTGIFTIVVSTVIIAYREFQIKQFVNLDAQKGAQALATALNFSYAPADSGALAYEVDFGGNNYSLYFVDSGGNKHLKNSYKTYSSTESFTSKKVKFSVAQTDPANPTLPYYKPTYFNDILANSSNPSVTITVSGFGYSKYIDVARGDVISIR